MTSLFSPKQITQRDYSLLRGLFESRIMTLAHAAAIYFEGRNEAAKKRVLTLKKLGYIAERPRLRAYDPSILFLTKKGFHLLHQEGHVSDYPSIGWEMMEKRVRVSPLTLRHELDVLAVKAAFYTAARADESLHIEEFSTWPRLFSFQARKVIGEHYSKSVLIKPDAFIRIHQKLANGDIQEHCFYAEIDRSTETQDNLRGRAGAYLNYYQAGGFAVSSGGTREQFKEYPFRVLWIFRNAERRNNAAAAFLTNYPPIGTHAWLSNFEEVTNNPLGAVWIRPVDYKKATAGSAFDSQTLPNPTTGNYRRCTAREEFVETVIERHSAFNDASE